MLKKLSTSFEKVDESLCLAFVLILVCLYVRECERVKERDALRTSLSLLLSHPNICTRSLAYYTSCVSVCGCPSNGSP